MAIISFVAIGLGFIAAIRGVFLSLNDRSRERHPIWEAYAGLAAIGCVITAFIMIRSSLEYDKTFVLVLALTQLLFGLAAIVVFPTRWRLTVEGLGAVALGIFSFLTGFSIGIFVMPFALALGIAAWLHNDRPAGASG